MEYLAQLVVFKFPCTACVIINSLNKETLEKVSKARTDFTYEIITINNPKEIVNISGVEVEKLPIILINGEQITAGSIMSPRKLNNIIDDFN